jgi:hypothetical protein
VLEEHPLHVLARRQPLAALAQGALGLDVHRDVAADAPRADGLAVLVAQSHFRRLRPGVVTILERLALELAEHRVAGLHHAQLLEARLRRGGGAKNLELRPPDHLLVQALRVKAAPRRARKPAGADHEIPTVTVLEADPLVAGGEQVHDAQRLHLRAEDAVRSLIESQGVQYVTPYVSAARGGA